MIPSLSKIEIDTFPFTVSLGSAASTLSVKLSSLSTAISSTARSWIQASDSSGEMVMVVFKISMSSTAICKTTSLCLVLFSVALNY